MAIKAHIIVNPASAGGKTRQMMPRLLGALRYRFGNQCSVFVTNSPFAATRSTRAAIDSGVEFLVAVGGDGTIQEIVNGFFSNGSLTNPNCELGILSSGTGNGFAQSLDLSESLDAQLEGLFNSSTRRLDIGKVWYCDDNRDSRPRYFINECQLGIGGEVVKKVRNTLKRLGGRGAFALGTLPIVFTYRNQSATVTFDDQLTLTNTFTGIVIANGAFTGGGMNLTPGASMDDGFLDVLLMLDLSVMQRLSSFPRIYSGRHMELPCFRLFQARKIRIESEELMQVEADGESLGVTPCAVEIVPSILRVRCVPENKEEPHATMA